MADTIVRVYENDTRVLTPSPAFFTEDVLAARTAAANAASAEAIVASSAAIAAAAAAIITGANINFTVDASLVVRPENNGGANAIGLAAACSAAAATGGVVALTAGATYLIDREVVVPVGVNITGPRAASLKLKNQVSTTLTGSFTSGTGAKTFTVTDASQFAVGQTVMFANTTTHVVSPNDSFSHAGRQISAIAGNTVTIAAGPNVNAHAAGDIMASTAHLLRCQGDNLLQGFTVDGNAANNSYAHWITSALIAQEGNDVRCVGLHWKDTPSDALLAGGPSGSDIYGSTVINCTFENIGNNGCHFGNARQLFAFGNRFVGICKRFGLPIEQGGGGAGGRGGHMDGAWIYSNDVADGMFVGNYVEDSICGVGAMGTTSPTQVNDDTIIANNIFVNCQIDCELTDATKRVVFTGNKCRADFPFASVNGTPVTGNMRWTSHSVVSVNGNLAEGRVQNLVIANNSVKNGSLLLNFPRGFAITGNIIDNRMMSGSAYSSTVNMGIVLQNYEAGIVKGNTVMGGAASIYLQNSNILASASRDTIIEGNLFLQPYTRALSGALTAPATHTGTVFRGNVIRADTAMTMEDGVTLVPVDGLSNWRGVTLWKGLQIDHNEVWFNNSGAQAFATAGDTATDVARRWNKVNGLFELFNNFASDAAAATGGVAVGGTYRNGSAVQQRVA